ncbi:23S rRNA (uracil(1939)-C(5))-methyltransferase RlmD [Ferruginibacter yonginensis]|uniref:23S rRNA (Uracil(1939)-C(5))-methyltransferase RlmD n=1 Tax=Ferruginibacter yonginensis TaxID=1310416 RepID=A0ABV8QS44_9BACT
MKRKKPRVTLHNITITDYAAQGKALARYEGKVIFTEGAVPGDVVDLVLTKNKKDFAEARITQIIQPSPDRVTPFCQHFGVCGGCKWQMLPYEKQLAFKQQEATQNLLRIGKVTDATILPIAGATDTEHYRNKLEFTFSNKRYLTADEINDEGVQPLQNSLGFHVPRIFDKTINIFECFLMDDVNNRIRNTMRQIALQHELPFYDIKEHTGWLRNLIIRKCTTGELMVNLCINYEDEANTKMVLDALLAAVPEITTLLYTINPKWNDSIYDLTPITYFGKGYAIEKLGNFEFIISPKSFFQTNTAQANTLYSITQAFAQLTGNEVVYDLYCGTGSIGIYVSPGAKKIVGVELIEDAIEDAKKNAALNNITHAHFFAGDVIKICDDAFFETHGRPDVVITDPPRAGMHEKLVNKLLEIAAPVIVYVSCNTATMARDILLLSEKYAVEKVQAVDMFPHTHHIECVARLVLKATPTAE